MGVNLTFSARTEPKCKEFLKIQYPTEEYLTLDACINNHPDISSDELKLCKIWYRGKEKNYVDYIEDILSVSNKLEFYKFDTFMIFANHNIRASYYFIEKASDCLQNARYFTMKSYSLFTSNDNLNWSYGYLPQFAIRCLNFGTAITWYSNAFDQLLQAVYWAYELYINAYDREGNKYNDSWDVKKIMKFCTYEFVIKELKDRNIKNVRQLLILCFSKIEEIRKWANYIKHKGGVEYLYLEPDSPFEVFVIPPEEKQKGTNITDDRFSLKNFKSPIEIDIDEKIDVLINAHMVIYGAISKLVDFIDFEKHKFRFNTK